MHCSWRSQGVVLWLSDTNTSRSNFSCEEWYLLGQTNTSRLDLHFTSIVKHSNALREPQWMLNIKILSIFVHWCPSNCTRPAKTRTPTLPEVVCGLPLPWRCTFVRSKEAAPTSQQKPSALENRFEVSELCSKNRVNDRSFLSRLSSAAQTTGYPGDPCSGKNGQSYWPGTEDRLLPCSWMFITGTVLQYTTVL